VHTVVISTQHLAKASLEEVRRDVMEHVIKAVIPAKYMDSNTIFHINPCGLFIYGGPMVFRKNLFTFCIVVY
jgi:S-adenosylmethionine synthetase